MDLIADRVERGRRVQRLQEAIFGKGDTNAQFLAALVDVSERYGVPIKWDATRLSKIRTGIQNLSLEDVASFVHVARDKSAGGDYGDWYFLAFGVKMPRSTRVPTHDGNRIEQAGAVLKQASGRKRPGR